MEVVLHKALLPWTTGPKDIEIANKRCEIFSNESIDTYFQTNATTTVEDGIVPIGKDRLIGILNKIVETEAGYNILKALKTELDKIPGDRRRKIALQLNDENSEKDKYLKDCNFNPEGMTKDEKEAELKKLNYVDLGIKNFYAFDSARAIQYPQQPLIININKNLISEERYIFDGNKIITHEFPANEKSEAYFIAHELTHVVSFLNFIADSPGGDWDKRKDVDADWTDFFKETERMQEIYHGLLLDGFTPKQIIEEFKNLFSNTEETRNVLGLVKGTVDGQETLIGEGAMFREQNGNTCIVTYLVGLKQPQTDVEKAVLKNIRDMFDYEITFTRESQDSIDAEIALGKDFAGFNLVNVPQENSAIEAIKKIDQNLENKDFYQEIGIIDDQVNFTIGFQRKFAREYIPQDQLKAQTEFGNLSIIARRAEKSIVVVQSDETKPSQYTLNQFDAHGQITPCEGTLQQIREQNPNAVFIYYNGVNHFQALVPKEVGQQVQN